MARGGYTRRQLKQDRFADAAAETLHWTVEHQRSLIIAAISAAVVLGLLVGYWFYMDRRNVQAGIELGAAMRTHQAPLATPGEAPQPGLLAFTSAEDRSRAAMDQFRAVIDQYPRTRSARLARYFIGVAALELGEMEAAEAAFQETIGERDADLAALARIGLASVYRATDRLPQAVEVYQALVENPAPAVPRATAQLELAATYEAMQQRDEARRVYEQVRSEEPTGTAAQIAATRLQTMQ